MTDRGPIIELRNVSRTYRLGETTIPALQDASLTIQRGEFLAIMGPSGSGKSTMMNVIGLLDVPDSGSYHLFGTAITARSEDDLAALRNADFGFVFQQFHLLPRTDAIDNASLPLLYARRPVDTKKVIAVLSELGLSERLQHRPTELSGGQQQRVAIARALSTSPSILLADEPTGNLDSASAAEILAILHKLNQAGMTIILVTHDREIASHASRIIHMKDGRIVQDERGRNRTDTMDQTDPTEGRKTARVGAIRFFVQSVSSYFNLAFRALAAHKVRALLSMIGILIGTASVIAMMALGAGASESIKEQFSSMGSNLLVVRQNWRASGNATAATKPLRRLELEDAKELAELPGIKRTAGTIQRGLRVVAGNKNWQTDVLGTEPSYAEIRALQKTIGRFITDDDVRRRARVAAIGRTAMTKLFDDRNPIGEVVRVDGVPFQIVGVLPSKGSGGWRDRDDVLIIPVSTAMYRLMGTEFIDNVEIEVASANIVSNVQVSVVDFMRRKQGSREGEEDPVNIMNMAEMLSAVTATSKTMGMLLSTIAAISMIVGGIGIMNIMLVSVAERTREIGLRKAVGARKQDILGQFLVEAIAVSITGGLLGIALGWSISVALSNVAGWTSIVTAKSVALAFGCSALTGLAFGFWPARKAASLHPIEALRYE